MSGEVPEFDVARILFLVSLRQAGNKGYFKIKKKKSLPNNPTVMAIFSVTVAEPRGPAQEQPAGIDFVMPHRAVSLDVPSKHACGRREVGE